MLRAHFGLPTLEKTLQGIREIADSEVLDVISIADDQNTQENFFHPEERNPTAIGAGGVPLRSRDDLLALHEARSWGNHPLMRIYAGTRDFCKFAGVVQDTIHNAWAAIPLFFFNKMDGRGPLSLADSITQHLNVIKWHVDRGIPVEVNDPHHWGLRDAPDIVSVADSFLCAQIVKTLGVRHYVAQYMFNSPPSTSIKMDLAKMLAMQELNATLEDSNFTVFRQTRTGLASYPLNLNRAKGQLAIATTYQLALRPHIIHVVTHTEAQHAATPAEIAESCEIVNQVITRGFEGIPDPTKDPDVVARKDQLVAECRLMFRAIDAIASALGLEREKDETLYLNPRLLTKLVTSGLFDAPHLINNPYALGRIRVKIVNGACITYDPVADMIVPEEERIKGILDALSNEFTQPAIIV